MEELPNQISVEITRDRKKELMMSKIDLDYAYGQMKLSKETSRQCVFASTGRKFNGCYRFKNFTVSRKVPTETIGINRKTPETPEKGLGMELGERTRQRF